MGVIRPDSALDRIIKPRRISTEYSAFPKQTGRGIPQGCTQHGWVSLLLRLGSAGSALAEQSHAGKTLNTPEIISPEGGNSNERRAILVLTCRASQRTLVSTAELGMESHPLPMYSLDTKPSGAGNHSPDPTGLSPRRVQMAGYRFTCVWQPSCTALRRRCTASWDPRGRPSRPE